MSQAQKATLVDDLPAMQGEVMRAALRLIKTRGDGALNYAEKKSEWMAENGDEEDQAYWHNICRQIDILLYEND